MLKLIGISKSYQNVEILKDININFREKEFVAILGPSGSGKSTLLNVLSAIEIPDKGKMLLGNIDIFKLKKHKQDYYRANYINYIFQNYNLIKYLSVKDNLLISSNIKGNKKINFKIILKKLNVENLIKKKANKLSGGEEQRVAIARSLVGDIKILLADEPTGALDSNNSHKVMKVLKDISKDKLVVMVTHNKNLAYRYASRIIKIKDGKIIYDSNPNDCGNNLHYLIRKTKLSFYNIVKMTYNNLSSKKIRTYLISMAFSIGLISLSLVLGISNGFNKEIKKFEENNLYNYPLIISKERVDLTFNSDKKDIKEGVININNYNLITNDINEELLNKINRLDKSLIDGIAYYKNINSPIKDYLYVNPTNKYFKLLAGNYPAKNNEVLLLLDQNKSIKESVANYLKINEIMYSEILNKDILVNNIKLTISGVVISNNNYFQDMSGILYNSEIYNEEINEIFIYPKDYQSKLKIKEDLKDYNVVDDSETVVNITKNFVQGISYVLIAFSFIALIVSVIMISIITYISVLERVKEIGILKSLGATSRDVKRLFLSENLVIGFLSFIFTLEINQLACELINNFTNKKIGLNILHIDSKIIFLIFFLTITLTYIAGYIPARKTSKKKVIDTLRYE